MIKKILALTAILFLAQTSFSYISIDRESLIKIGIITNIRSFSAYSNKGFILTTAQGASYKFPPNVSISFSHSGSAIINGKLSFALPVKIESNGHTSINGKYYRGYFLINKARTGVNIVNVLDIEDYVKAVVPKEADISWNIEALKTQSVISRTYALATLGKHSHEGFDLCDKTHCQVYGDISVEADSANEAVAKTKGEVLTFNGQFAQTVFHSNSGGHTENPKYVWSWKEIPPYLKGVRDPYSKDLPHFTWENVLDESFIRNKLKVGKISSIRTSGKTSAGSAIDIIIRHSKGTLKMNAAKFRLDIDPNKIKSVSNLKITKTGDSFVFKGNGWGHRVGLSQWGAKAMADKGISYGRILSFYYPGTKIEKVKFR
jgi:stage II sporulation protein D